MYRHTNTIVNDGPESLIPEVYFHPDGSLLAVPFRDANEVRLLDAKTMAVHRLYRNPEAMLDMPHAVMMTHDHLIAASRHQLERPATFTVYRLSDDSSAPIVTFETPVDHLRECHSLDIRGSILVGTYTLSADCIGAAVSYYFDHDSGEIRGPPMHPTAARSSSASMRKNFPMDWRNSPCTCSRHATLLPKVAHARCSIR
jgi:hypothetical protein